MVVDRAAADAARNLVDWIRRREKEECRVF